MEIKAEQKYARISPTKLRPLVLLVKLMEVDKALEMLPIVPKKGALVLLKVVRSAVANAIAKGFSVSDLVFKEILVNEGPRLKRGRPVSRGMWHPYVRRTSHIRVILETKTADVAVSDEEKISKDKRKGSKNVKELETKSIKRVKKFVDGNKRKLNKV